MSRPVGVTLRGAPLGPLAVSDWGAAFARAVDSGHGITFVDSKGQETPFSYAALRARALGAARMLADRGVTPGARVAIALPTSPDFVAAYFGALMVGAIPVPLYPPQRLGRLDEHLASTRRMLEAVDAACLIADERSRPLLAPAVDRPVLSAEWRDAAPTSLPPASPDDVALIQFSSGSTSGPKPVALTHRQLLSQCQALRAYVDASGPGPHLGVSWLPLYHDMGLVGCLLLAVYYPGPLVLLSPETFLLRPGLWLECISRHRATICAAPNFAYAHVLQRVKPEALAALDLSSWRLALSGAEPVVASVARAFCDRFAGCGLRADALRPVYGLSEAALAVTLSRPDGPLRARRVSLSALHARGVVEDGEHELVSVGPPAPGFEVEVRDEAGQALAERRVGRIVARGPSVMRGYWQRDEATARVLQGGWLDTGDLGFVEGGELFVCGRAKDVVIVRGANHAPETFEAAVAALSGLRAGAVVAAGFVPPQGSAEALLILAECDVGELDEASQRSLRDRIDAAVLERTGVRPHTIGLLAPGALLRTSSGKLRRQSSALRFLGGTLTCVRAREPRG